MTKEDVERYSIDIFSIHPDRVDAAIEDIKSNIEHYAKGKKEARDHYEIQCHNLEAAKHRLTCLTYLRNKIKDAK